MRRAAAVARRRTHARRCRRPRPPRAQQRPPCRRAAARRTSTPHRAVAADRAVVEATVRTNANERKARLKAGLFAQCLVWIISGLLLMHGRGPLYPEHRTSPRFRIISLRAINNRQIAHRLDPADLTIAAGQQLDLSIDRR